MFSCDGNRMKTITLSQGLFALVDDGDFEMVSTRSWYADVRKDTSYAMSNQPRVNGKRATPIKMHRFIMGVTDPKIKVDHENHDGLDCQRHNLRIATHQQNISNQRKTRGSSQYKGVSWRTDCKKWEAKIEVLGQTMHLGRFIYEAVAAKAYDAAASIYFGEFAKLN